VKLPNSGLFFGNGDIFTTFQWENLRIANIILSLFEINKNSHSRIEIQNENEEHKLTKLRKCECSFIDKELLAWFSKTQENVLPNFWTNNTRKS